MIQWAAFWSVPVAESLGVLREFARGDQSIIDEMVENLPLFVGQIQRKQKLAAKEIANELFLLLR